MAGHHIWSSCFSTDVYFYTKRFLYEAMASKVFLHLWFTLCVFRPFLFRDNVLMPPRLMRTRARDGAGGTAVDHDRVRRADISRTSTRTSLLGSAEALRIRPGGRSWLACYFAARGRLYRWIAGAPVADFSWLRAVLSIYKMLSCGQEGMAGSSCRRIQASIVLAIWFLTS